MSDSDEPIFFINHDAMYWRGRALAAEEELLALHQKHAESVNTSVRLAQTSSDNLLRAIMSGAFDELALAPKPEIEEQGEHR